MTEVFGGENLKQHKLLASDFSHFIALNNGGTFLMNPLPLMCQTSPIFGLAAMDVNSDGFDDVLCIGNNSYNRVRHGPDDALNGCILINQGGTLSYSDGIENGFYVPHDGRSLISIGNAAGEVCMIASENNRNVKVFKPKSKIRYIKPPKGAISAIVETIGGQKKSAYIGYGSGYLSGSSPKVLQTSATKSIIFYNNKGQMLISSTHLS